MNRLPPELLTKILAYLPPESLHSAYRVNTHWSNVAKTLGVCQIDFTSILQLFRNREEGACVRHLLIRSRYFLPKIVFNYYQLNCPNIRSFDYDQRLFDTTKGSKRQLTKRHCLLTSDWRQSITHLPACHKDVQQQEWSHDDAICKRLESMYIWHDSHLISLNNDRYLHLELPYLPQLTTLTLHVPNKCRETPINAIHRCCSMLTSLTLRGMSLSCVYSRRTPSYKGSKLQVLKLENVTFLSYPTFFYFPQIFPNVKTLQLLSMRNQDWYTDGRRKPTQTHQYQLLYKMATQLTHLTSLTIDLDEFDPQQNPWDEWLEDQMYAYFSRPSKQHVLVDISHS